MQTPLPRSKVANPRSCLLQRLQFSHHWLPLQLLLLQPPPLLCRHFPPISTFNILPFLPPPHLATLMFFPPYLSGQFTCDICRKLGGSHWLYRCTVFDDFDTHLGCAINAAQLQFRLHPAQYCPPMTPVYRPSNSGGGGGTAYASTPSSDPWKKIGKCMWAALRLSDLAFGTGGLINLGSSLFDTLDQLLGDS
ncbi:uncharacterized protein LOC116261462 [Nymphaea colorata]|nr:uncharacterized protein LOC116261462 [Nymphaea colorata]